MENAYIHLSSSLSKCIFKRWQREKIWMDVVKIKMGGRWIWRKKKWFDLHLLVHLPVDVNCEQSLRVDYQCVDDDVKTCLWITQSQSHNQNLLVNHTITITQSRPACESHNQDLFVNHTEGSAFVDGTSLRWLSWFNHLLSTNAKLWENWETVQKPGWTTALIILFSPHSWVTCVDDTDD